MWEVVLHRVTIQSNLNGLELYLSLIELTNMWVTGVMKLAQANFTELRVLSVVYGGIDIYTYLCAAACAQQDPRPQPVSLL